MASKLYAVTLKFYVASDADRATALSQAREYTEQLNQTREVEELFVDKEGRILKIWPREHTKMRLYEFEAAGEEPSEPEQEADFELDSDEVSTNG